MNLQNIIRVAGWLIGLPLEVLVIVSLARGSWRRFPVVLVYGAALFVTTLVEIPAFTQTFLTDDPAVLRHAARVYWIDEWILEVLVFAVVLSLIEQTASKERLRRVVRTGLAAGALLVAGITFYVEYLPPPAKFGYWMTPWTRDLNFSAAILDVALWMMLLASRNADRRLLLISSALGLQFTGEAIGEAIRKLSIPSMAAPLALSGSVLSLAADMACLYLLWRTFRAGAFERRPVLSPKF